jgi:hypothetical protein
MGMTNHTIHYTGLRKVILSLLLLFFSSILYGAVVPVSDAHLVAGNYIQELQARGDLTDQPGHSLVKTIFEAEEPALYIYNIDNKGFLLISGEDEVFPVLGWSLNGSFSDRNMPPAFSSWLEGYRDQIAHIRSEGLKGSVEVRDRWEHYRSSSFSPVTDPETPAVPPLLTCTWNQNTWYNAYCPPDPDGPGGRALAGCVATAMGQVMYYYRYPETGSGTSTYFHNKYGHLSANHGSTTYRWNEMGDVAFSKSYDAIAELLYHLAVSVEMNFGPNASGAYSGQAAWALQHFFDYDISLSLVFKNDFSNSGWANLLKANLNAGHPMYYHGYGSGGHAFNVDGYQDNDHFHFNWGWGGSYNGYFYLTALNPGTTSFTNGQGAIVNFKPPTSVYPPYCTGTPTLTALMGSLDDGSGPVSGYQDNTNCYWLIQPSGPVHHMEINFSRFATETPNDLLYVFDGPDQQAPLLATLSGDSIPPPITTSGGSAFLHFVTNNTTTDNGWLLHYEAFRPQFCTNLQTFTGSVGTFDDGSGPGNNYNMNTNCKYLIQTGSQHPVKLSFNYFSIEDSADYLRIYDPTTVPSTLLATYTGHTLPPDVIGPKGQLMLIFYSNSGGTDLGWEVTYSSQIGVEEYEAPEITLYPNPASENLFMALPLNEEAVQITIMDISGREIIRHPSVRADGSLQSLNVSALPDGLYMLNIEAEVKIKPQKLMIRKQ